MQTKSWVWDQSLDKPDSSTETPPGKLLQLESKSTKDQTCTPQTLNGSILNHSNLLKLQVLVRGSQKNLAKAWRTTSSLLSIPWKNLASESLFPAQRPMEPATDDLFSGAKLGPIPTDLEFQHFQEVFILGMGWEGIICLSLDGNTLPKWLRAGHTVGIV